MLAGHRAGVKKSGVLSVNRCTVLRASLLTAVCDAILETEIFCRQYLDINNSCNK